MKLIRVIAARIELFVGPTASIRWARATGELPTGLSPWRTIAGLLVFSWLAVASAAPGVTVVGIQVDGATAVAINDFTLRRTGGSNLVRQTLTLQDNLESGVELIVPTHTVIILKSSNGNTITLQPGSRFIVSYVGDDGESYTLEAGGVSLDVVKALNFFNVNYRKFLAIVKGTKFSVEVDPDKEIRFAVTEGTVVIDREVKVKILVPGDDDRTVEVTASETLKADLKRSATYSLNVEEYLKTFESFKDAEDYFRKRLEESEASGDPERIAASLDFLGLVTEMVGKSSESLTYFMRGIETQNVSPARRAKLLNDAGVTFARQGELLKSIEYFQNALAIMRRSDVQSAMCQSCVIANIGASHFELGDRIEGVKFLERARTAATTEPGREARLGLAMALRNLAYASLSTNGSAAREMLEQALAIYEEVYAGRAHPNLVSARVRLAAALSRLGNYSEASRHLNRAREMQEKIYPTRINIETAFTFQQIARNDLRQGRLVEALEAANQSLAIYEQLYPAGKHSSVVAGHVLIGEVKSGFRDWQAALTAYTKAHTISIQLDPSERNARAMLIHQNIGICERQLGRRDRAISSFKKALVISETLNKGDFEPRIIWINYGLGALYVSERDFVNARPYFEKAALSGEQNPSAETVVNVALSLIGLGRIAVEAGDVAGAVTYFERAIVVAQKVGGRPAILQIASAQDELARTWRTLGDASKAEQYTDQARITRETVPPAAPRPDMNQPQQGGVE